MVKVRKNLVYLLFFSLILLLTACTDKATQENENSIAKVSDFEDNIFTNSRGQSIGILGGDLRISGIYDIDAKKISSLDEILAPISDGQGKVEKIFSNAKIKTEDEKYFITTDEGVSLTFTKVGERVIKDEEGIEYTSPK